MATQYNQILGAYQVTALARLNETQNILSNAEGNMKEVAALAVRVRPAKSLLKDASALVDPPLLSMQQKRLRAQWKKMAFGVGRGQIEGTTIYRIGDLIKNEKITQMHKDAYKALLLYNASKPLCEKFGVDYPYITSNGFSRYVLGKPKGQNRSEKKRKRMVNMRANHYYVGEEALQRQQAQAQAAPAPDA